MKGIIVLTYPDEELLYKYDYLPLNNEYRIIIQASPNDDFLSLISKPWALDESLNSLIKFSDDKHEIEELLEAKKNQISLLQNTEYIAFKYSIEDMKTYIEKNPILKTKKIVILDAQLNLQVLSDVKKVFGTNTNNVYFKIEDNNEIINYEEFRATLNIIDGLVKHINAFDFSPLEKIMYTYDLVRDRVYNEEEENDDENVSRDLTSVLLGDKIVCRGYARIFKAILDKLGIPSSEVLLQDCNDSSDGHARNEIYIKDEKYNINGVYYFDLTYDSKEDDNSNNYLFSYRFFAMTKPYVDNFDKGEIIDDMFPYYSHSMAYEFMNTAKEKGIKNVPMEMIDSINHMSKIIYGKKLIDKIFLYPQVPDSFAPNIKKVYNKLSPIVELFDKPISAEILLKVLFNVRKNQYYNNPSKYSFGLDEFFKILMISGWNFDNLDMEEKLLQAISSKTAFNVKKDAIIKYAKKEELLKKIFLIKFTRNLKNYSEDRGKTR